MDRGAYRATVHGVVKSWTRLSGLHCHFQPAAGEHTRGTTACRKPWWRKRANPGLESLHACGKEANVVSLTNQGGGVEYNKEKKVLVGVFCSDNSPMTDYQNRKSVSP